MESKEQVMKEKYRSVGLDYDLIVSKYPNINEYNGNVSIQIVVESYR